MKTLYITDLDGTFLNNKAQISERSRQIIDTLTSKGLLFSVATARTYATVTEMFEGILLPCPLVLMNGVTIYDPANNQILKSNPIEENLAQKIVSLFRSHGIEPMLYFQMNEVLDIFYCEPANEYQREYVSQRINCKTKRFIKSKKPVETAGKKLVYIVSLDYYEKLKPVYDAIFSIAGVHCMFYRDTYTDCWFLEIIDGSVSKATGALYVKEALGIDKIVAFGDNLNDIPLFEIADECYAVSNSVDQLKAISTAVIGSNDENAVAEFILERFNSEQKS